MRKRKASDLLLNDDVVDVKKVLPPGLFLVLGSLFSLLMILGFVFLRGGFRADHFAKYRKIAADGHVLELEVGMLRFNCTSMKRLRIIPSVVLARERNFEVVLATLDGDEQFALKRVNHNFTEPVVAGHHHHRKLPSHLRRPVHLLNDTEAEQLEAARRQLQQSQQSALANDDSAAAGGSRLSFARSGRHRGRPNERGARLSVPAAEQFRRRTLQALPGELDDERVQSTPAAEESLVHESVLLDQTANGHPNLPHYLGACHTHDAHLRAGAGRGSEPQVRGLVFGVDAFASARVALLAFLQEHTAWCVGLNVAIQLVFLVQFLSRSTHSVQVCDLRAAQLFVLERDARLLLPSLSGVLGADRAHERCQPGVSFGRPADEPAGEHVPVFLTGTILRMMTRRNAELRPYLSHVAATLVAKNYTARPNFERVASKLIEEYENHGGHSCFNAWRDGFVGAPTPLDEFNNELAAGNNEHE